MLLLILLLAPSFDDSCPEGMVRNDDTEGACCWPGQAWSGLRWKCVGLAECPEDFERDASGEQCVQGGCPHGKRKVEALCCWPGQEAEAGRCVGEPVCAGGFRAEGDQCVRAKAGAEPEPETLPYVKPAPGDYLQIKPGRYTRGSPLKEPGRFSNERSHDVQLSYAFEVKKTEVTQGEWRQLVGRNPSRFVACGPTCPVERVNWYEALAWLNRLSAKEDLQPCYTLRACKGALGGACEGDFCGGDYACQVDFAGLSCTGYRLPTEAEWEYAARAGVTGPWPAHTLSEAAWYGGSCPGAQCGTHPVGQKQANAWGLVDVSGNVMEWTWDAFAPYPIREARDPLRSIGRDRVVRGGAWAGRPIDLRLALRSRVAPGGRSFLVGFRPARTLPSTPRK